MGFRIDSKHQDQPPAVDHHTWLETCPIIGRIYVVQHRKLPYFASPVTPTTSLSSSSPSFLWRSWSSCCCRCFHDLQLLSVYDNVICLFPARLLPPGPSRGKKIQLLYQPRGWLDLLQFDPFVGPADRNTSRISWPICAWPAVEPLAVGRLLRGGFRRRRWSRIS